MNPIKTLFTCIKSTRMEFQLIFQLTASGAASVCVAGSLTIWLWSITHGETLRLMLLVKNPIILGQALIAMLVLSGSPISLFLATQQVNYIGGESSASLGLLGHNVVYYRPFPADPVVFSQHIAASTNHK